MLGGALRMLGGALRMLGGARPDRKATPKASRGSVFRLDGDTESVQEARVPGRGDVMRV